MKKIFFIRKYKNIKINNIRRFILYAFLIICKNTVYYILFLLLITLLIIFFHIISIFIVSLLFHYYFFYYFSSSSKYLPRYADCSFFFVLTFYKSVQSLKWQISCDLKRSDEFRSQHAVLYIWLDQNNSE